MGKGLATAKLRRTAEKAVHILIEIIVSYWLGNGDVVVRYVLGLQSKNVWK